MNTMSFDEIKSMLELSSTLQRLIFNPKIDVTKPTLKSLLRTYKKEILEIKEVNREFIDGKRADLPYSS